MTSLKQKIGSLLTEVEKFLVETLKGAKLNSGAKDEKDRILEKVRQLLEEIPGSSSSNLDNSYASGGSLKGGDSGSASGSFGPSAGGDEEVTYSDDIAKIAVSDLKNKLQSGLLDKKKKSLATLKSWDHLYCVVSHNIFYMYRKQSDVKQKEAFCLSGYEFHEAPGLEKDAGKKEMCFELTKTGAPSYQFRASSKEGLAHWREAIIKGIQLGPADEDDEAGEMYDYLCPPIDDPHSYINLAKEEEYDNPNLPTTMASPIPSNPPPGAKSTATDAANYQNLPQANADARKKTPPSGSKPLGARPPMIDIKKGLKPDEAPLITGSIQDRLKQLNPNAEMARKTSADTTAVKKESGTTASTRRGSLPANIHQISSPQFAVEIYDDLEELPASKTTPGKTGTLPPPSANRGRGLPPPPTSGAENSRPKGLERSKSAAAKPTQESEQLPPPDSVKNLKKLFQ
ncbi:src kinase-associated phosphoprotein 2-A-like isoform X1 [Littorina saxatilis]|uniref:PH domain-containing protein n=1 Tax=Littorina saxatilis TaxID=31220 RepID=A0AAN9AML6_9CAEN